MGLTGCESGESSTKRNLRLLSTRDTDIPVHYRIQPVNLGVGRGDPDPYDSHGPNLTDRGLSVGRGTERTTIYRRTLLESPATGKVQLVSRGGGVTPDRLRKHPMRVFRRESVPLPFSFVSPAARLRVVTRVSGGVGSGRVGTLLVCGGATPDLGLLPIPSVR